MSEKARNECLKRLRQALAADRKTFESAIRDYIENGESALDSRARPGPKQLNNPFVLGQVWVAVELEMWRTGCKKLEAMRQVIGKPGFVVEGTPHENPFSCYPIVHNLYYRAAKLRKSDPEYRARSDMWLAIFKEAENTGENLLDVFMRV